MATAVAVVAAAGIGAFASSRAAGRAAEGQQQAGRISAQATQQARGDINRLFNQGGIAQREGFGSALNLLGQTPEQVRDPFQQGNVLAQEQIGRGLGQAQNALLGRPVNLGGFQARSVPTPPPLEVPQGQQAQIPLNIQQIIDNLKGGGAQVGNNLSGGFRLPSPRSF